ncbi:MAG: transglutaminase domain-containing protein [Candidatus Bathyarchaeia archaeon]
MKKLLSIILIFLLCIIGSEKLIDNYCNICYSNIISASAPPPTPSYTPKAVRFILRSNVTFINRGDLTWILTDADRSIGLFMNNSWQTVSLAEYSHPVERVAADEDGNLMAILDFYRFIEPGESVSYSVYYNILSRPRAISYLSESESDTIYDIPEHLRQKFCTSNLPWLTWDEGIRAVALSLAGNETNVLRIVKRFVAWIWKNIEYPGTPHEVPFYPNETLKKREGDCDDQAILLVTFCRILGIPAYVQAGCIYLPNFWSNGTAWNGHLTNELYQVGWHGWAVVYIPPWGWLPVDLTFVVGPLDDPVNAIIYSAATLRQTIQYANISATDYVSSTREYRDFLQKYGFYLYSKDEMQLGFLGDLNGDFTVNIVDVAIAAVNYGLTPDSPLWNGLADVAEPYGVADILDIAEVAREFGLSKESQ